jgi:hypothetical protein
MPRLALILVAAPLALTACSSEPEDPPSLPDEAPTSVATAAVPPADASPSPAGPEPPASASPLAAALVRAEWRKADNRAACAPLSFTTDGGAPATARRANFSGGWAVAFDTPGVRSAYGVAGPGVSEGDEAPTAAQAERLGGQWPEFDTLPALPAPAFAGYGVEGGGAYPPDNADGRGLNSLAYVRVGGQRCTYNVWSRLGRAHLETLLRSLRML